MVMLLKENAVLYFDSFICIQSQQTLLWRFKRRVALRSSHTGYRIVGRTSSMKFR